jgi:hypothetical protein
MQIRNNWGELIGEINTAFTDKGAVITTNTIYHCRNTVVQNISIRGQSRASSHDERDRWEDSALAEINRPGPQQEHTRRDAIWDMNLVPAG